MRQIGPREQRHTPVRSAEREMMHYGEKPAETCPDDHTAPGPMRQQRLTDPLAELHGHRTHGQKMLHAPESWQQVKPGTMKGGAYGHEVCLPWQGTSKNTAKTFIVRHFSNAVMVHNNGQVWLWSPAHLKPR